MLSWDLTSFDPKHPRLDETQKTGEEQSRNEFNDIIERRAFPIKKAEETRHEYGFFIL